MAKTQEELNQLKQEYETLAAKLDELTAEELKIIGGGGLEPSKPFCEYYAFYDSTDPAWYGPRCENASKKGTLPVCAGCRANK